MAHEAAGLRPTWRRRLGAGLAVALAASALSVLLVELILRVQGYRVPVLLSDRVRAHYRIAPNAEFVYLGYLPGEVEDFANPVKLNALGFHDRDYPVERPTPATYRILVLGDSYVAAWEVPVAETFHKLLEARLVAEDPLRRASYEVIAFGQGRTAQETEIEWLRKYGALYHPDMVLLLFFCGNDFMENDAATFAAASRFGNHYIKEIAPRKIRVYEKLLLFPGSRLNGLLADAAAEYYAEHLDRFVPGISRKISRTRRSASTVTRFRRSGPRPSTVLASSSTSCDAKPRRCMPVSSSLLFPARSRWARSPSASSGRRRAILASTTSARSGGFANGRRTRAYRSSSSVRRSRRSAGARSSGSTTST